MVTSRQFARGVVRTMRAMERAAKQAERQRIAHLIAVERQAIRNAAEAAAADYETTIEALTGAHRLPFVRRDWYKLATMPDVLAPKRHSGSEDAARATLDAYSPGWFARTFKREAKQRAALADAVAEASRRDEAEYRSRLEAAARQNADIAEARRIVGGDPDTMVAVLERDSTLGQLPFSVEGLDTVFIDGRLIAFVDGLDLEDMPEESVSLLKSGKASFKPLAASKRHELHREAICSAAVRVAIEILAILPIEVVEVVMLSDLLDRGSGHIDSLPVLYLRAAAQALDTLNLARTEGAALVERLGGHMDWSRRDGFRAINVAAFSIDVEA